jgi:hypothetical protein
MFASPVDDTKGKTLEAQAARVVLRDGGYSRLASAHEGNTMSSRWPLFGTLSLLVLPGTSLWAQQPRSERETSVQPQVVQVVAKEPMDEVEMMVEVIKAMPRTREEKAKQELPENFKIIKVKRDTTEEPLNISSHEATKVPEKIVEKTIVEKPMPAVRREETLTFLPAEKQKAVTSTPVPAPTVLAEEKLPRVVKVPVREMQPHDWSMPAMSWPEAWTPSSDIIGGEVCTSDFPTLAQSNVGFIDSAIPGTQVRFRYDYRVHNSTPDRAEYWTARNKQYFDGVNISGRGFSVPESGIDIMEGIPYVEWAFNQRVSAFLEFPIRYVKPTENPIAVGGSDLNFGAKVAYFMMPDQVQTFQLRFIVPTGSSDAGLGTGHSVIEPSFLMWQKLTDKLTLESEFRNWIPIDGTNHAGYIIRYGTGLSYDLVQGDDWSLRPVLEATGWTILRGLESRFIDSVPTFQSTAKAQGTIIELAPGMRGTVMGNCDWYLGYSFNITSKSWFEDNVRFELRWRF